MPSTDPAIQEAALPFRVYGLEGQVSTLDQAVQRQRESSARISEAVSAQGVTLARHDEVLKNSLDAVGEVKTDVGILAVSVAGLADKVATSSNRIAWTFAAFSMTSLGSLTVFLVTK